MENMYTEALYLELHEVSVRNYGGKTSRDVALYLTHFHIDCGEIVFVLGKRGAGKSPLHDVLKALFETEYPEGSNLILPQCDNRKPDIEVGQMRRSPNIRFHSQSGNPEHLPSSGENVLVYCDDPIQRDPITKEDYSSAPEILDRADERKLTMLMGTDPDRLHIALNHFLRKRAGRILWLHDGEIIFFGNGAEFVKEKDLLIARFYSVNTGLNEEMKKFRTVVLEAREPQT